MISGVEKRSSREPHKFEIVGSSPTTARDFMDYSVASRIWRLDKRTGFLYWKLNVSASGRIGQRAGCLDTHDGYRKVRYGGIAYREHHIVWLLTYGSFPDDLIDHKNRNRSDNRPSNLRLASHAENGKNKSRQRNNLSGVPGVYWSTEHRKWKVQISVNNKRKFLGLFDCLEEARVVKQKAEATYFKEFAPV